MVTLTVLLKQNYGLFYWSISNLDNTFYLIMGTCPVYLLISHM